MAINWEIWDRVNDFNYFTAACLWLEIDPNHEDSAKPRAEVAALIDLFKKIQAQKRKRSLLDLAKEEEEFTKSLESDKLGQILVKKVLDIQNQSIPKPEPKDINRRELELCAEKLELRPRLVFIDSSCENEKENAIFQEVQEFDNTKVSDKRLDERSYKSWCKLVKILALECDFGPDNTNRVSELHRIAQLKDIKLGKDTIRKLLRAAFEVD